MLIYKRNVHTKNESSILFKGPRKSRFPLNLSDRQTDIHTDIHTYKRTDISVYRVASLLKMSTTTVATVTPTASGSTALTNATAATDF